jgi:hypothetical protein
LAIPINVDFLIEFVFNFSSTTLLLGKYMKSSMQRRPKYIGDSFGIRWPIKKEHGEFGCGVNPNCSILSLLGHKNGAVNV